jgi:hypothetical protein
MMALAANGTTCRSRRSDAFSFDTNRFSGSKHDLQHPSSICRTISRLFRTSPLMAERPEGMRPGFRTMKAMSSPGSPPMSKNSIPCLSTRPLKAAWVARRIRWPERCNSLPMDMNGWTSPRDPTTWMTILRFGQYLTAPSGNASDTDPEVLPLLTVAILSLCTARRSVDNELARTFTSPSSATS